MQCQHYVIALLYRYELAVVVVAIVGETTTTLRWRSRCHDATMEIMAPTPWRWRPRRCFSDGDQEHKTMMAISCHIYI